MDKILADEINRATPRTQSALLEAMAERQVTVDGKQHQLSNDFFVIATQNPFEFEGTYPLPESQLDRFLIRLSMGYPNREEERQVLTSHRDAEPVDLLKPVIEDYARNREEGERFGDFVIRHGHVKATTNGLDFHHDVVIPE